MANIRLAYIFPSDSATLTPSSENSSWPVENIQDERPGKVWQSDAALSGVTITFDLGSAKDITGVFLSEHNFTANATVNIKADDNSGFTSPDVDVNIHSNLATLTKSDGTTEVIPRLAYFWATAQTYRYWRITITDAGNGDGYLEIGIAKFFEYVEPAYNVTNKVRRTPVDPSKVLKTAGRFPRRKVRTKYWRFDIEFGAPHVDRDQQDEWLALINEIGYGGALVVALDPDNHPTEDTIYGTLETLGSFDHVYDDQSEIPGISIIEARAG